MTTIDNKKYSFAVSGKMGAGKDTVADYIAKILENNGIQTVKYSFATPLREEIARVQAMHKTNTPLNKIAELMNVTENEALGLINILKDKDVYKRSDEARAALQYWGPVRRAQDVNYWAHKVRDYINNTDKCVYITDARHVNEVKTLVDLSIPVVRLEIDDETRINRIIKRDGYRPTETQLTHHSEVGLDDYPFANIVCASKKTKHVAADILSIVLDEPIKDVDL